MRTHHAALKFAEGRVAVKTKTLKDLDEMIQGTLTPGVPWSWDMYRMLVELEKKVSAERWEIQDNIDFVLKGQ